MSSSNELPTKCLECAKSNVSHLHQKCRFCGELEFQESVLCDLNRCIQDAAHFECYAFKPTLKLVSASEERTTDQHDASPKSLTRESYLRLFQSDKIKYERALALQRLNRDPDGVYVQLKYHLVWNVSYRMPLFAPANDFISFVYDTFMKCSERVREFVNLLYLAPDHIHLYVESDGELSIEEMVQDIKRFSNKAIVKEFPFLKDRLGEDTEIWDEAYSVKTVG